MAKARPGVSTQNLSAEPMAHHGVPRMNKVPKAAKAKGEGKFDVKPKVTHKSK